jgi:hypothetical protein
MPILNIHLDTSNQIFVRDYSENLYVFHPTQTLNIVVGFDTPSASYSGSPVTVNALVSAWDFNNQRSVASVQLMVSGGTFSGGATTATVNTIATGDVSVPVTITSAGTVVVTPIL